MSVRTDLLALDAEKLGVLANKGLVKRARREIEAGRVPAIEVEPDGTVVATLGGVVTRLAPSTPLSRTECSCGALRACRHRVLAVFAYQAREGGARKIASEALPAFDDDALRALLGPRVLERARKLRRDGFVADVVPGETPTVELSTCTVRFLVADDLAYARCDCENGTGCEHIALAVWALGEARARGNAEPRLTVEIGQAGDAGSDALGHALALTHELLLDGVEGSGAALSMRFARALDPLEKAGLAWPIAVCEDLREALAAYTERRASYRPRQVASLVSELAARARAGRGGGVVPARAVLGMDEPARTRLEHARLISLGVRLVREIVEPGKARVSALVHLADPDTLTVLVLRREWETDEDDAGAKLGSRPIVSGANLGTLARGQVVTRAAERRANRAVSIRAGRVARTTVTLSRGNWDMLGEPLGYRRYAPLGERLRALPPVFVRPRVLAERVRVLAFHAVENLAYHPGEQTLSAVLVDDDASRIDLVLGHSAAAPGALDVLALALEGHYGEVRYISGEVRRSGDRVVLTPLAVSAGDRVVALDLEAPVRSLDLPLASLSSPADPLAVALREAREQLDRGAHQGLLHAGDAWVDGLLESAEALGQLGLGSCSARLRELHARMAARIGGDATARQQMAGAWVEASLRVRLALEAL